MDGRNEGRLTSDKRKRVSLHQNPYSRENGGGIEANSKEIITNDDYLFTRPIIVRFFADGTRPRSRSTGRRKEVKRRDRVRKRRLEWWEKEQKSERLGRGKKKEEWEKEEKKRW